VRKGRLPSFLIIGAAKSGTTSIASFLAEQPDVFLPNEELRFFGFEEIRSHSKGPTEEKTLRETVKTLEEYKGVFAGAQQGLILGERSNHYLYSVEAPARIHDLLPEVRLIAILRNPAERAFSQFLMTRRYGSEPEPDFGRALALEDERVDAGWGYTFQYARRGLYGEQLARYRALFSANQIKVLLFEDLVRDPLGVATDLARFVGSVGTVVPDFTPRNPTIVPRSPWLRRFLDEPRVTKEVVAKLVPEAARERVVARLRSSNRYRPALAPRIRRQLGKYFEDDISKTEELIGRDLSAWRG
jgi:hypothetical protein